MVEVDGEFCIPQEENEARYYIDLGPILGQVRSAWALAGKLLLFVPAMFLFILAIQLMKAGAAALGPTIQGQFPFANGLSTMGTGWLGAYLVLSGSPVAAFHRFWLPSAQVNRRRPSALNASVAIVCAIFPGSSTSRIVNGPGASRRPRS